jgi:hypothetical protein
MYFNVLSNGDEEELKKINSSGISLKIFLSIDSTVGLPQFSPSIPFKAQDVGGKGWLRSI